jgi:hypothetical protein
LALLGRQFARSTLVYVADPPTGMFFRAPEPYLTLGAAILFLLGMGVAISRLFQASYTITLAWIWSVVILGGVLTVDPPASTRLIMTAPAVAVLLGVGLNWILDWLANAGAPRRWLTIAGSLVVSALCVRNAVQYLVHYRSINYFADANSEMAMEAGLELRRLGPQYSHFVFGDPRLYADFPTLRFLAPNNDRASLSIAQAASEDFSESLPALFISTPDNVAGLDEIAQRYPGGIWEEVPRRTESEVLYYAYIVEGIGGQ